MILVDTSLWIDHLHARVGPLAAMLERGEVVMHPFVIGELACGTLNSRKPVLKLLSDLPSMAVASDDETLFFIERHRLMGKGIGYIDAHILAAVTLNEATLLWTRDKRLHEVAMSLRIAFAG
jgi:predicted nucleic acid-binding protein